MAAPYRSAQKLRKDNCLSELTSNATLKATTLANLGIAAEGAQLDNVFAIENSTDITKKIAFSASGVTTANTVTLSPPVATGASTLVGTTATQTLTNKTLTLPVIASISNGGTVTIPSGADTLATIAGSQVLTNKTIDTAGNNALKVNGNVLAATAGSATVTIPNATDTLVNLAGTQTLSGKTFTGTVSNTYIAGTASVAPINLVAGTNLTSAAAGAIEYDGVSTYITNDTTSGRAYVPAEQYFRLTSNGGTISTIGNYFGATSNVSLVASAFYEIDIYSFFLNSTSGTVVWTLTNSAAPTKQNIYYEMSPATGVVAPPGTATMLIGQVVGDATATLALTATAALTDAVNHYMHMRIWLQNGTGTSLKIQATKSAGTITPLVGSYYRARRLPAASVGSFAA